MTCRCCVIAVNDVSARNSQATCVVADFSYHKCLFMLIIIIITPGVTVVGTVLISTSLNVKNPRHDVIGDVKCENVPSLDVNII